MHLHRICLGCLYIHVSLALLLKNPLYRGESGALSQGIQWFVHHPPAREALGYRVPGKLSDTGDPILSGSS